MEGPFWYGRFGRGPTPVALACLGMTAASVGAATADLTQFGIEELMQVKVVSAAKTEQTLQETAGAVFVITADDIRRSGATNVPEALRLAPGVEVARIDSRRWAITIRGFNGRFANKLLVMIDGRSIYNPQFSGVYWEAENVFLPDIERIEVIRGPGGALWGANAVNGVINIITKTSQHTQGGLVSLTAGNEARAITGVRYGGKVGDGAAYRAYGQFTRYDGQISGVDGGDAGDDWRRGEGGVRLDWAPTAKDAVVVDGGWYDGNFKQKFSIPLLVAPYAERSVAQATLSGGSVRARWEHRYSATSRASVQGSYQYLSLTDPLHVVDSEIFDLDFQHDFSLAGRQEVVWGLVYRRTADRFADTRVSHFDPGKSATDLFGAFVQDQVELIPEQLRLIAGLKIEHNDFTGWEWQPSARMLWTPHPRHRVWGAVSRAVRTPSRGENDLRIKMFTLPPSPSTGNLPALLTAFSLGNLKSEELIAYEAGYRALLSERFSLDTAVFYNDYDRLIVADRGTPFLEISGASPHLVVPLELKNRGKGFNAGFELAADWRPVADWRLRLAYSHSYSNMRQGVDTVYQLGKHDQLAVSAAWNLRDNLELDMGWRYVNGFEIATFSALGAVKIDPRHSLDLGLRWRPRKDLELSVVATDVLDESRLEFVHEALSAVPTAIERSLYGQVKWSF